MGAVTNYVRLLEGLDPDVAEGLTGAAERSQKVLEGATRWLDAMDLVGPLGAVDPGAALRRAHEAVGAPDLQAAPLPTVRGCADALAQVFEEVLRNAVEAAEAQPVIRVTAQLAGDLLVICVADNGPGWTEEEAERAFRPFKSGGVGLAIVASLMRAMGGTSRGASADEGAAVYLSIPTSEAGIMGAEDR